ncbi:putative dipeptidyl-aminopeptidase B [Patellaria atrata CBS 101060]|uniref:dipeptidyl-peptidase IV n=1 Tax=Patellaria atrata CBS 101060 TaxID=1346257 RepID=A0A9P4VNQ6_9PEZI|nr:putative dipeptidyl-aminopeptidase B [Patellaria atrata CBS 101060]
MAARRAPTEDETQLLTTDNTSARPSKDTARDSLSSVSTISLVLERINEQVPKLAQPRIAGQYTDDDGVDLGEKSTYDPEDVSQYYRTQPADRKARRVLWVLCVICCAGWVLALVLFITHGTYKHSSTKPHDPLATTIRGSGKKVTLDQVQSGFWSARKHGLKWIAGTDGEDGLLLERGGYGREDYLLVEDVRHRNDPQYSQILMKRNGFFIGNDFVSPSELWPSPDLKKVLAMAKWEHNWRHSFTGEYYVFDVETQTAEPLVPDEPHARIQLASWSPRSDSIVFTRDNNMYMRVLDSKKIIPITTDGGPDLFYGVPDWVYEEEVFAGNSATWWSQDAEYIAFLRTNESAVPTYPVQYFVSRPSGKTPAPGEENYPEVRDIKYPKAGASNPIVHLQFYDIAKGEVFTLEIENDFEDADRLITEVVWCGRGHKVLIRETNRESDLLKMVLMDVERRSGRTVRTQDVNALDGGWMEVSEDTTYIPADPGNGRAHDGYIDTVIHEGYDHLAYFTPLDNPEPKLITNGNWEVVNAPSAIDLKNNIVYFVATKESSIQRHVYYTSFTNDSTIQPLTDTSKEGYYDISFSKSAGYALLSYNGPGIPWQKIINTPSNAEEYEDTIEENKELAREASRYELPINIYQTVNIDGFELNLLERRPPHFDKKKRYPVLFYLYGGPGSQTVSKSFRVDFQSFIASNLGYIVVTLDGRGTGFLGRETRVKVRGDLGYWEAHDQIEAAKMWAKKRYVDADRIAIWGWSYGGFMTLKTLEQDGGRTFKYGMAVAPVTDWRFYGNKSIIEGKETLKPLSNLIADSIYTERYMHTPQNNPQGYDKSAISNTTALKENVRFLIMHGTGDDNVHVQNSLTLLDNLDLDGVENYDVHVFPDSDHSIYYHNANRIVYDKLTNWLINAFNGEWLRTENPKPIQISQIEAAALER